MDDLLTAVALLTPVTIGFTEAAKRVLAGLPERFAPLISLAAGVAAAFLLPPDATVQNEIAAGVLTGLSASGLYSGTKAMVQGMKTA